MHVSTVSGRNPTSNSTSIDDAAVQRQIRDVFEESGLCCWTDPRRDRDDCGVLFPYRSHSNAERNFETARNLLDRRESHTGGSPECDAVDLSPMGSVRTVAGDHRRPDGVLVVDAGNAAISIRCSEENDQHHGTVDAVDVRGVSRRRLAAIAISGRKIVLGDRGRWVVDPFLLVFPKKRCCGEQDRDWRDLHQESMA